MVALEQKGLWLVPLDNSYYYSPPTINSTTPAWQLPPTMSMAVFSHLSSIFRFSNHVLSNHPKFTIPGPHPWCIPSGWTEQVHTIIWCNHPGVRRLLALWFYWWRIRARKELPMDIGSTCNTTSSRPLNCLYPSISNKSPKNENPIQQTLLTSGWLADKVASYVYLLTPWHLFLSSEDLEK